MRRTPTKALLKMVHHKHKWWRSKWSIRFYRRGKWVKARTSRYRRASPMQIFAAGDWRANPDCRKCVKVKGTWRKAATGPGSHTIWLNRKWVMRAADSKRNNPHYWCKDYSKKGAAAGCTRRAPRRTAWAKRWVVRRGLWYRSKKSQFFFYRGKWVRDGKRNRDPRWRRRRKHRGTLCLHLSRKKRKACRAKVWRRLPKSQWRATWVRSRDQFGPVWFRDNTYREVWWYGRWRKLSASRTGKTVSRLREQRLELRANAAPVNLDVVVDPIVNSQIKGFLTWFLKDYVPGKTLHSNFSPYEPEQGIEAETWSQSRAGSFVGQRTATKPEPREFPNPRSVHPVTPDSLRNPFSDNTDGRQSDEARDSPLSKRYDSYDRIKNDIRYGEKLKAQSKKRPHFPRKIRKGVVFSKMFRRLQNAMRRSR